MGAPTKLGQEGNHEPSHQGAGGKDSSPESLPDTGWTRPPTLYEIECAAKRGCIPLRGGWALMRDDDEGTGTKPNPHYQDWFLSGPPTDIGEGIWVAKFWDGPEAGEKDAIAFAYAIMSLPLKD